MDKKFGSFGMEQYQNDKGEWLWKEDNTSASIKKPCPKCKLYPLPTGEDPCLGILSGVQGACCGHGVHNGYIWFDDGRRVKLYKDGIINEQ